MAQLTRREALLAGLALPGIAKVLAPSAAGEETVKIPKRFEEIAGFEVAGLAANYPLALVPLGSLEFHGPQAKTES